MPETTTQSHMNRIWIIGATGSGKSTLARQIAELQEISCIDLDELHWLPNWQTVPEAQFFASLKHSMEAPGWAIAGNYTKAHTIILSQADTIIWLDYSLPVVLSRQLKRIYRRIVHEEPCCNGNHETLSRTLSRDSILLWLFRTYNKRRHIGWNTKRQARYLGIKVFHFRRPSQCAKWLQTINQTNKN